MAAAVFKLEAISLKNSDTLTEKWVQDQIANDSSLLGLGDLELKGIQTPAVGRRNESIA